MAPPRMMQFYPCDELRERIVAFRTRAGVTGAQLVWAAVVETRGQIDDYLTAAQDHPGLERAEIEFDSDDIFAAFPVTPIEEGGATNRRRQMGVRLDPRQIIAIDQLVSTSPAADRSAYVCAALTCYLDRKA